MKKILKILRNRFMRTSGNNINYNDMQKMLRENKNIIVIDVRTKDEFSNNHLKDAKNLPLQDICESKMNQLVRNKSNIIIVYCEYGGRSQKACIKMKRMGYDNVYNLEGGQSRLILPNPTWFCCS